MQPEHEIMTTEEVADLLRVSLRVIRSMRARGKLPGIRVGKGLRFRRADALALLDHPSAEGTCVDYQA